MEERVRIPQATKEGFIECEVGGVYDASYPNSTTRRGRVQEGGLVSPTITCNCEGLRRIDPKPANSNYRIRKLTPRECFRLMGVDDPNIDKLMGASISNSQLYKCAGNSIVVDVLYHIFRKIYVEPNPDNGVQTLF